jgi:hypothetical protein
VVVVEGVEEEGVVVGEVRVEVGQVAWVKVEEVVKVVLVREEVASPSQHRWGSTHGWSSP